MTMDRDYHREYSRNYYHQKRSELIERLGGRCSRCSKTHNLEFDHKDPREKSFDIGKLLNYSKQRIEQELTKCQLLCDDCHKTKTQLNRDGYETRARGEDVTGAVLTEDIVRSVKQERAKGATLNQLMKTFPDIKKATLYCIISGTTWKHVQI